MGELVEVDRKVKAAVTWALNILGTAHGKLGIAKRSLKATEREAQRMEIAARTWSGEGTKPVPLTAYQKAKYFASRMRKLRREFVLEAARVSEADARSAIDAKNAALTSENALEFLYFEFLREFLADISEDGLKSGLEAKSRTEDETGIVFLQPQHMQHAVYTILSRWWTTKKKELKKQLEMWGATNKQDQVRMEEERRRRLSLVKDEEAKEAHEKEVRRQNRLIAVLEEEELRARAYYKFEFDNNLRERRDMKEAEQAMRLFMLESKSQGGSKYDVGGSTSKKSSKQERRDQLKKEQAQKLVRDRECKEMLAEDDLAMSIRTEEKKQEQLAALKKEMELYALENEAADSTVIEDLSDDEGYASSVLSDDSQEDLIPETMPPAPDESPEEQRDRVKKERLERRKYRHRRRREKAQRELRKRRAQHEAEQAAVLEAFRKDALIAHAKAELEWMELEEEARVIEKQAFRARANLRKVALYCQGKGMDELRARSKAIYFRKECTEKTLLRDNAHKWLEICTEEEKKKRKTKVRVDRDTLCMDTRSIAGVYQRFFTPLLHQQLHTHYFRTLSMIIINRSEIVATERRQMLLFEMTRRNEAATAVRERDLQKTWRKRIRQDYMRLFRSELGKKIFGRSQRKVLAEVFKGWVRYWYWHLGHKEAFQLKYAVIKHGVDLRRLHPKILGMQLPGRVPRDDDVPTLEGYDKRVLSKPVLEIEPSPEPSPEKDPHADDDLDSPETRRKKANMREYLAEKEEDEKRRRAKEAEDEALYGPRFTEIMDGNRRIQKDRDLDRAKGGLAHETGGVPVECVPCSPRHVPDLVAQKAQSWQAPPEPSEATRLKFRKTFNERLRERSIICKTCG